jgi:hypothetical protein
MFKTTLALLALVGAVSAAPSPSPASQVQEKRDSSSGSATYYETGLGACGWNNGSESTQPCQVLSFADHRRGHDRRCQLCPIRRRIALRESLLTDLLQAGRAYSRANG